MKEKRSSSRPPLGSTKTKQKKRRQQQQPAAAEVKEEVHYHHTRIEKHSLSLSLMAFTLNRVIVLEILSLVCAVPLLLNYPV